MNITINETLKNEYLKRFSSKGIYCLTKSDCTGSPLGENCCTQPKYYNNTGEYFYSCV